MTDRDTPIRQRVSPVVELPRTNGHDVRADDTPEEGVKRPSSSPGFEERVETAILELIGKWDVTSRDVATSRHSADTRMKAINTNHDRLSESVDGLRTETRERFDGLGTEMGAGFERLNANLDSVIHEQRRQNEAFSVSPMMRPPLPSLTEDELDVVERTHNGTAVYKVSDPQFKAIRETDVRHALREFAVGERERTQVAIEAALKAEAVKAAEAKKLEVAEEDARLKRVLVGDVLPLAGKTSLGALVLAATGVLIVWLKSLFSHH